MAAIQMKIRGRERVIKNIAMKELQMQQESEKSIKGSARILFQKVSFNISRTCHDLADLAAMGHPYARDHILNPHSPYYQIHMQSGDMRRALTSDTDADSQEVRGGVGYTGDAEESLKAPASTHSYLRCVIFGTNFVTKRGNPAGMVSRDFLNGSLGEVKGEIGKRFMKDMSKAARRKI